MARKPVGSMQRGTGADGIVRALIPLSSRFDRLLGQLELGIRDQRHYDELEQEAHAIGSGVRAAFRGKRGQ